MAYSNISRAPADSNSNSKDLSSTFAGLTVQERDNAEDFGPSTEEDLEEQTDEGERDYRNPKGSAAIQFCLDNKDAILALHSSLAETKVFQLECDLCRRWYKHCMFSKAERRGAHGYTACRWCQLDKDMSTEWDQFSIHTHIHCNRGGKKECGLGMMSLTRPEPAAKPVKREAGMADLAAPEVVIKVVNKKMSQKERKAAAAEARARAGL